MAPNHLDIDRILRETFVARVEHHPTLTSTNDRAAQLARELPREAALPLLIVADTQTAGRGRGSHRWWTGPGSLAMSLLVPPEQVWASPRDRSPMVALAVAVAVVQAVSPLLPGRIVGLHWPNDIMAAGRKLAGILVEVLPGGRHVLGIGLNSNNTLADAPVELRDSAATLLDLTGRPHDATELLIALVQRLDENLRRLVSRPGEIAAEADSLCLQRGEMLTVQLGGAEITGSCAGIGPDGALLLDTPEGRRAIYSGVIR